MTELLYVCRATREDKFLKAVAPIAASLLDELEARENNEECARLLNHLMQQSHTLELSGTPHVSILSPETNERRNNT